MKFDRIDQWAEMSECRRFTVAMSKVAGRFYFQAWQCPKSKREVATLLGTYLDVEAAREKCREAAVA